MAVRLGDGDVIRILLQDRRVARLLDSEMYNGDTPLVVAVKSNNVAAVQILADHGADLWRRKLNSGNTVLHFAASLCSSELLKTLLKYNPPSRVITKTNQSGEKQLEVLLRHLFTKLACNFVKYFTNFLFNNVYCSTYSDGNQYIIDVFNR